MEMWILYICVLEAVIIVTGNVAVILIFTLTPALRMRKYCLLVSLAVADFFVGLISVPFYLVHFLTSFTTTFLVIYQVQDVLFGTASVFGLASVAVERLYAVFFPFKHRALRKSAYIIGVATVWFFALLFALLRLHRKGKPLLIVTVTAISISLVTVIISYALLWIKINCVTNIPNHAVRPDIKMIATLLIVTIISLVAWIPFQVITVYGILCGNECLFDKHTQVMITKVLQYGNSLVNPITYALRIPLFRRALVKRLWCNRRLSEEEGNKRDDSTTRPNVLPLSAINKIRVIPSIEI